tara:strand:- start:655 stop:960 length:306 start_codon:yes stop_codon:yes gene_type:complete
MEIDSSDRFKFFSYFIGGFGLGVLGGLYYSNIVLSQKKSIIVKLTDNDNNIINKDFHLSGETNILYFRENLENVNIEIILDDGVKHNITSFSGREVDLHNY